MADSKITALTAISTVDPTADPLVIVDVSDTSMAASGTTKKSTINQLLGSGGTATLASATITGDLTVDTNTLKVDSANNRVGIGTASPSHTLDVTSSGTTVIRSLASAGNQAYVSVAGNGGVVGTSSFDLIQDGSSNAFVYNRANAYLAFGTNNSERLRIDASGNLGIGVTPSAWASGNKFIDINSSAAFGAFGSSDAMMIGNAYWNGSSWIRKTANNAWRFVIESVSSTPTMTWQLAANGSAGSSITTWTQAMTLDASGNLLVGKTTSGAFTDGCQLFPAGTISIGHPNGTGSGAAYSIFAYDGVKTGDITQNGTTGVLYNTVSDYRLKESVTPLSGGLARVSALKPSIYKWKSDGSSGEGFLAHELAEVVPFAVTGEKDAVNEDGSIKAQSIDMSRVVPILVAAIQELAARVQTLETR